MPDGLFANPLHWVILIVVVLIIFGPGKLPGVGSALGKSLREFKRASQDESPGPQPAHQGSYSASALLAGTTSTLGEVCTGCGHENAERARFCGSCGAALGPAEAIAEHPTPADVATEPLRCAGCQTESGVE